MYQLISIGEMTGNRNRAILKLKREYGKGLKYAELFSHMHVFYRNTQDSTDLLFEVILKIASVDMKNCTIEFAANPEGWDRVVVFDLKPFFPCEDSVKMSKYAKDDPDKGIQIKLSEANSVKGIYELNPAGCVKTHEGRKFLEFSREGIFPDFGCSHIKVIWWFHKFDEAKYRKTVECDPPYENAPRTGIFATRSPVRPNPLAMTIVKLIKCDSDNRRLYINDIECFDQTPFLAVWPYQEEKDLTGDIRVPEWLEHWPKWLDDRSDTTLQGNMEIKVSTLERLLEEASEKCQEEAAAIFNLYEESEDMDGIRIEGARENNLKGIDCRIPYHQITAVAGVSGSGKSSLVEDTIYAECRRRMEFMTSDAGIIEKPRMDGMYGSIPAVLISQKAIGKSSRSTVGTYSNAYDYLRSIFATVGIRHCPECGHPVIPLTEEEILGLLSRKEFVSIYDLNKNELIEASLYKSVRKALEISKGAFYAELNGKEVLLQTRLKCYHCDRLMFELTPAAFNYSDPESMCPVCSGYGEKTEIDVSSFVENPQLSILDGASSWWGKLRSFIQNPNANWMKGEALGLAKAMKVDLEKPWCELPEEFKNKLIYGSKEEVTFEYTNKKNGRNGSITRPVEGVYHILERLYSESRESENMKKYIRKAACDCCSGERLNAEGRLVAIGGRRYPQIAQMTFQDIAAWCRELPRSLTKNSFDMVKGSIQRLYELSVCAEKLGIGHLELSRNTATLSGGEGQRMKFLSGMQNHLSGVLYILDEPSRGLHPKDYSKIAGMIKNLKRNGNTVIMVEHNEDMLKIADNIIEIGPGAGEQGGYLVGEGSLNTMLSHKETQISKYMSAGYEETVHAPRDTASLPWLKLKGVKFNNLKNIDVRIPVNAMTCICGVSGSGKSSLMKGVLYPELTERLNSQRQLRYCSLIENAEVFDHIVLVEQSEIGRTPRSVPATYIGIMDTIRAVFAGTGAAAIAGLNTAAFSFNSAEGHCDNCHGDGRIVPEFTQDIWITCPVCKGRRYKRHVLEITFEGKNIAEVLLMSVNEASEFFANIPGIAKSLNILQEVGLGYLKLGQSSVTLSGGEASRLRLAKELIAGNKKNTLYLIDEPTTGLHFSDIENLLRLFHKLVEDGNTIVLIEHNQQIIRNCDWLIELGPGAGKEGGNIIRQEKRPVNGIDRA